MPPKTNIAQLDEIAQELTGDAATMAQSELPPELREPRKVTPQDMLESGVKMEELMAMGLVSHFPEYQEQEKLERLRKEAEQIRNWQQIDAGPQVAKSHERMKAYFEGADCLRYDEDAPTRGPLKGRYSYKAGDPILGPDGKPQFCKRVGFTFSPRDGRPLSFGINGYIVHMPVNKLLHIPTEFVELILEKGRATDQYELVQNAMVARATMSLQMKIQLQDDPSMVIGGMPSYMAR